MNNIELVVTNKTKNGCMHVQLFSDRDDLGYLYLSKDQFENLSNVLKVGCFNKDIEFLLKNPYDTLDEIEE